MALIAASSWRDYFYEMHNYPELGYTFGNVAPIFKAFGTPENIGVGDIRMNWSSGATAAYHSTSNWTASISPASVGYSKTYEFGYLTAQAQETIAEKHSTFALKNSIDAATHGLYSGWVTGILTGTGAAPQIMGCDTCTGLVWPTALGMVINSTGSISQALSKFNLALSVLPQSGYNVAVCGPKAYANLITQLAAAGGTSAMMLGDNNFGHQYLTYLNCFIFPAFEVTETAVVSDVRIFNIGPEGVVPVTDNGQLFNVDGPKKTVGTVADVYDITLCYQLVYKSPRACALLQNLRHTA